MPTQSSALPAWQVLPALVKNTKPVYGFYVSFGYRFMFQHFSQLYAAKRLIEILIPDGDYTRTDDFTIQTNAGLTIRLENPTGRRGPSAFNAILDYELTPQERDFSFTPQLLAHYQNFTSSKIAAGPSHTETPDNDQQTPSKAPQRAPERTKPAPKPRPEGLISVATIAGDLKIDPKQARQALRKAAIPKPDHGWHFPSSQVPAITAAIKEHLK